MTESRQRIAAGDLIWTPSPQPGVWRKRFVQQGPAESCRVTSLVRYEPGAQFNEHPHPQGEEIFVLEGVFSDGRGDSRAGTHLLNAEGFVHAPRSIPGCLLFVKLRQYPGDRSALLHVSSANWQARGPDGVESVDLYECVGGSRARLTRLCAGAKCPELVLSRAEEIFVLQGAFEDEFGEHPEHTWLRYPAGTAHSPRSASGCLLHVCIDAG